MNGDQVNINLMLISDQATDEELREVTIELALRLKETDVENVEVIYSDDSDSTSMGDDVTAGLIALEVLKASLPALIAFLLGTKARIRQRIGHEVEVQCTIGGQNVSIKTTVPEEDIESATARILNTFKKLSKSET